MFIINFARNKERSRRGLKFIRCNYESSRDRRFLERERKKESMNEFIEEGVAVIK
jgi:hypothetical protein